jgi:hypothetical protein
MYRNLHVPNPLLDRTRFNSANNPNSRSEPVPMSHTCTIHHPYTIHTTFLQWCGTCTQTTCAESTDRFSRARVQTPLCNQGCTHSEFFPPYSTRKIASGAFMTPHTFDMIALHGRIKTEHFDTTKLLQTVLIIATLHLTPTNEDATNSGPKHDPHVDTTKLVQNVLHKRTICFDLLIQLQRAFAIVTALSE